MAAQLDRHRGVRLSGGSVRRLDPSASRTVPWKNGGGATTELLVLPDGAGLDAFDLRVSRARVEADGPFSEYPGIDRTLVVVEGDGLRLETADGASVVLGAASAPFSFTGDDPVHATLTAGPVTDFNVMTRRSALGHRARKVDLDAPSTYACSGELGILLVLAGRLAASDGASALELGERDVLVVSPADRAVTVRGVAGSGAASVLLVDVLRR